MDEIQRRFTAYLLVALDNQRSSYVKKVKGYQDHIADSEDALEAGFLQMERERGTFEKGVLDEYTKNSCLPECSDWMEIVEDASLITRLKRLKKKEQQIVFRHLFLNQDFEQIGAAMGKTAMQVKQSYYYAIQKMRRKLG